MGSRRGFNRAWAWLSHLDAALLLCVCAHRTPTSTAAPVHRSRVPVYPVLPGPRRRSPAILAAPRGEAGAISGRP